MMFAALIIVAILFLIRLMAPQTIGETARRKFLADLRDHYPNHTISIRRGSYDPNIGLTFEGLRIAESPDSLIQRGRQIVFIDRIVVQGSFDSERMKRKENPIRTDRVVIDGVQADAWTNPNGQWTLAELAPLPNFGPAAPRMDIRNVSLRILKEDPRAGTAIAGTVRPIALDFDHAVIWNSTRDHTNPSGVRREITLSGNGDYIGRIAAKIVMDGDRLDVRAAIEQLRIDRTILDRLPDQFTGPISDLRNLNCLLDAKIAVATKPGALGKTADDFNYRVEASLHDGSFSHRQLPHPMTEMRARFVCDPTGVEVLTSQALLGDAFVQSKGKVYGYQTPLNADFDVAARGLLLDDRLAFSLPASLRKGWDKVQPIGRIDAEAVVRFRNGIATTAGHIDCKGVDVRYEKFPFPVEQVVGRIELKNDILTAQSLTGRIGGNRMQCAFQLPSRPGITNEKSFVVATDGPIAIDETMLSSLTPRGETTTKLESFVRSLSPSGNVHLASARFSTDAGNIKTRQIDLRIADGRLRYEKFAYPLQHVNGTIRVQDDLVRLEGFRATNVNSGVISCDGTYRMPAKDAAGNIVPSRSATSELAGEPTREPNLNLRFRCANVPMDNSLRQSLPKSTQQVWDSISPNGILDQLEVMVVRSERDSPLSLDVTARQLEHQRVTNRILSLRPASLPYRIDITGGEVHFDGSKVQISAIRGSHDAARLSANGTCVQDASGRWNLGLDLHGGSRLYPDAELIASLPAQMQEAMRTLQLRGPVNVRGRTEIKLPNQASPDPEIDWNLVLQLEGNRIGDVGPVHSLRGEVAVRGHRDARVMRANGDVRIDSMHVFDLQMTNIKGPFMIVDDQLRLGDLSTHETIRGEIFGGNLDLDGEVILSTGNFDVALAMDGGQVPILLAEYGQTGEQMSGTFTGRTKLEGNLGRIDLLKGNGSARLSGANLYELPFLVQVLNILRVTPSEDHAFTDGEVEFSIFGERVEFSDMQIWGELVSLHGGGTLSRRRELDLTFNTQVSPRNTFSRIIRPLRSQRYTLWTIDVRGPLSNPEIERRALDGVSETLDMLLPGRNLGRVENRGPNSPQNLQPSRTTGRTTRTPIRNRY